jgi:hypothetical protein
MSLRKYMLLAMTKERRKEEKKRIDDMILYDTNRTY